MASNRYMIICTDISEPSLSAFNTFINFDTYDVFAKPYKVKELGPLKDSNQFYGQIKGYIPFIPAIGLCELSEHSIERNTYKEYKLNSLLYSSDKEISNICAYKTHTLNDEHKFLSIYNKLKGENSNLIDKKFSEINYKKYLDKTSNNDSEFSFLMPNNFNLVINSLENNKELYFRQEEDSKKDKNFIIDNLILPDNCEYVDLAFFNSNVHIKNLIAPNVRIRFDSNFHQIEEIIIDNIECTAFNFRDVKNIKINNIKINDKNNNIKPEICNSSYENIATEINNLTINTKTLITIDNKIEIKNIIGDKNKIIIKNGRYESKSVDYICKDKTFVITGAISGWTRDEIIYKIEKNGGKIGSTITSKTDYLLCENLSNSSKSKKALQYGTTIISGDTLRNFMNGLE